MQKISTCLWFDNQAEEAANYYVAVFKNSKLGEIARYPASAEAVSGKQAGSVMTATFQIEGRDFMALNGGPQYKFSEATSFVVNCENQEEVDYFWEKLTADGGQEGPCGWLKDKFGLSWQIVPQGMGELMSNPDPAKREKAMAAMLSMKKLDINALKAAAEA